MRDQRAILQQRHRVALQRVAGGMAAGRQGRGDDAGGRRKRGAVAEETLGARGELGEVRCALRIDKVASQTIEHYKDSTLHEPLES